MTSKLTREKAQWLHDACEEAAAAGIKLTMNPNELLMFTSYALAAMDSEPVKRVNADQMHHVCLEANRHLDKYGAMAKEVNKLLGRIPAQPAPVVPEEATPDSIEILASARRRDHAVFQWDEDQRNAAADSWNACRAAMLQASPVCTCPSGDGSLRWPCPVHPGNSPVIPEGWKLVPVEPNGDMLAAAQDAYGETEGDIASTLRAAIAAVPQENN